MDHGPRFYSRARVVRLHSRVTHHVSGLLDRLANYLVVLEAGWLITKRQVFLDVYRYWLKIFAVGFAMGAGSGLMMAYEIGANWSAYSAKVGPILGQLLAYETMSAFFLEAGFLGIRLFGLARVGPKLHLAAGALVAVGTLLLAAWILAANSWMQTSAGYAIDPTGCLHSRQSTSVATILPKLDSH
jgi:cytochrome d ubiquinol oxidase subunit I